MAAPLIRLPDWQTRLHLWLLEAARRPIRPGRWDCCLFGAGAIEAQTGVDLAIGWRGRYSSYAGGQRILRRGGYGDHVELVARHLREDHPITALPGDIAVIPDTNGGAAVGLVQGSVTYVLAEAGGLAFVPLTAIQRLFKVG